MLRVCHRDFEMNRADNDNDLLGVTQEDATMMCKLVAVGFACAVVVFNCALLLARG